MSHRSILRLFSVLLCGLALGVHRADQPVSVAFTPTDTVFLPILNKAPLGDVDNVTDIVYGVNFINSNDHPADAQDFANGQATGVGWNRWPLYWNRIETSDGSFNWSEHDPIVQADVANGFKTNAVLLGTPSFFTTAGWQAFFVEEPDIPSVMAETQQAAPVGLYDPVFTDGSDIYAPGKTINPNNRWARFVYEIVSRYKPGGTLAQANGWSAEQGITHWEMWNEPDYNIFWDSSQEDYARLLKVGYLAAKHADPNAQIMFGGLANNGDLNYYENVLDFYVSDPNAGRYGYYHDIVATHSYSRSYRAWYHVFRTQNSIKEYGLDKEIWLNETGVPAWDDYPGPVWDSNSPLRATQSETSDYIIQSAFYSIYAGVDAYFYFQLYDGCGNQPAFTDFPPHNGELCDGSGNYNGRPCAGDAHGLFRNKSDDICFKQHPNPGSARPGLNAMQIVTTYMQGPIAPRTRQRPDGNIEIIELIQPATNTRLIGVWALHGNPETATITALGSSALLISSDGATQTIFPNDGVYTLNLAGATNNNGNIFFTPTSPYFDPSTNMIGGKTYMLIEQIP